MQKSRFSRELNQCTANSWASDKPSSQGVWPLDPGIPGNWGFCLINFLVTLGFTGGQAYFLRAVSWWKITESCFPLLALGGR